ncbi:MAG TPA: hypothetical protein VGJ63_07015 [Micromonosporaceae bacterium]
MSIWAWDRPATGTGFAGFFAAAVFLGVGFGVGFAGFGAAFAFVGAATAWGEARTMDRDASRFAMPARSTSADCDAAPTTEGDESVAARVSETAT